MIYQKQQAGLILIIICLIMMVGATIPLFTMKDMELSFYIIFGTAILILLLFYQLTIRVYKDKVVLSYGVGIIKFTKKIDKINELRPTRTPWYWGLGIRFTPNGWLYNIHSLNALLIDYTEGGKLRKMSIGHPEPLELKEALQKMDVIHSES